MRSATIFRYQVATSLRTTAATSSKARLDEVVDFLVVNNVLAKRGYQAECLDKREPSL
jgi:hypothetical protein